MKTMHTPVPWRVEAPRVVGDAGVIVRQDAAYDAAQDDLRLIAAAPELLEALQSLMAWASEIAGDNCDEQAAAAEAASVELARDAIAKATGGQP